MALGDFTYVICHCIAKLYFFYRKNKRMPYLSEHPLRNLKTNDPTIQSKIY